MASYRQRRKGGTWEVRWDVGRDPETGRRRQEGKTGFRTRAEARTWYERNVGGKALAPSSRITVADWLDRWLLTKRDRKGNTFIGYEQAIRLHIKPHLGTLAIKDVTPDRIRAWHAQLATAGYAASSIRNVHRVFSTAMRQALVDGHLMTNPVARVPPPREMSQPQPVWSSAQIQRFLAAVDEDDPHEVLLATSLLTGLRLGELIDLAWEDVNLQRGTLTISHHQARNHERRWISDDPKGRGSRRTIAMPRQLSDLLRRERHRWVERKLEAGSSWLGTNYVYCHWDGRWLARTTITTRLMQMCQRARLPRVTPHGLRHCWASWMMELGAHPKVVQAGLGHTSVQLTLDRYSHLTPGLAEQSRGLIEGALGGMEDTDRGRGVGN